jgi:hypothetical protein
MDPGLADVLLPAAPVPGGHIDGLLLAAAGDPVDAHPPRVLRREPALQDNEVPSGQFFNHRLDIDLHRLHSYGGVTVLCRARLFGRRLGLPVNIPGQ